MWSSIHAARTFSSASKELRKPVRHRRPSLRPPATNPALPGPQSPNPPRILREQTHLLRNRPPPRPSPRNPPRILREQTHFPPSGPPWQFPAHGPRTARKAPASPRREHPAKPLPAIRSSSRHRSATQPLTGPGGRSATGHPRTTSQSLQGTGEAAVEALPRHPCPCEPAPTANAGKVPRNDAGSAQPEPPRYTANGCSSDELCGVNSSAPFSVMCISSSSRTPNSPLI